MTLVDIFLKELPQLGSPARAVWDKNYHKSKRVHWGVPAKARDGLVKTLCADLSADRLLILGSELWETNLFDPMLCATKILSLPRLKASPELWAIVLEFMKKVDGWALEDTLAHAAYKCLLKDESLLNVLDEWTLHPNFWMRRAALVFTLPFAKAGRDPERMLKWASLYAEDREWFIQKAIGWWLRVLGAHNPKRVIAFLEQHTLKGVALKEATRKLSILK